LVAAGCCTAAHRGSDAPAGFNSDPTLIFAGLTVGREQPSFHFIRGANRPSAGTTKAESSARNAEDPRNLIQVMLA